MQTEVDLLKLSPHQREVLTALVRKQTKSETARFLKIVEMVTPSPGVVSEATKRAVLERSKVVIEKLEREHTA